MSACLLPPRAESDECPLAGSISAHTSAYEIDDGSLGDVSSVELLGNDISILESQSQLEVESVLTDISSYCSDTRTACSEVFPIADAVFPPLENTATNTSREQENGASLSLVSDVAVGFSLRANDHDSHTFLKDTEPTNIVDADSFLVYESESTRIYRLSDAENLIGSRTGSVALKVPADVSRYPEIALRIYDEYIISRHLTRRGCNSVRNALKHEKEDDFHAIYLEWVPGETLTNWMNSFHQIRSSEPLESLKKAIILACDISGALSSIHDAGVVHNKITPDNIIVDEQKEKSHFLVKIIDLGSATILDENEYQNQKHFAVNGQRHDMISLGRLFYEMFSGIRFSSRIWCGEVSDRDTNECSGAEGTYRKRIRVEKETSIFALHEIEHIPSRLSVPFSLSQLVSNLMDTSQSTQQDRYNSVKEVKDDLALMITDPDRFLLGRGAVVDRCKLELPRGKLYGRTAQVAALSDAFHRMKVPGSKSEMALVLGCSGTGKSVLVEQLREPVTNAGGYFLAGKFDQLMLTEPFSAIIAAFTGFCKQVAESGAECVNRIRAAINDVLGDDIKALANLIPCLRVITETEVNISEAESLCGKEARSRAQVVFCLFVRAITSSSRPIVLFLDDLQWADDASLELVRALVTDTDSKSFLFIGAYRDNEIISSHPLALELQEIEKKGVNPTMVKVENMGVGDVNALISDTLCLSRRLTLPLADIVHQKTGGNALFIVQFLKMLDDDGFLSYCLQSRRVEWDVKNIMCRTTARDVITILVGKISSLSEDVQCALKLAACLGSRCDMSILHYLIDDNFGGLKEQPVPAAILPAFSNGQNAWERKFDIAVCEGLMDKIGEGYRFAHDEIQKASYSVIPESERGPLHLWIGNCICKRASASKLHEFLFHVVDQLNRGKGYVKNHRGKIDLAILNLRAGEKAISSSAFSSGASYLKVGIGLLGPQHWKDEYNLSLQLYNACAETEFSNGKYDIMSRMLEEIFTHAESFSDKIRAFYVSIHALGMQSKMNEAILTGFQVLEKLGEQFPEIGHNDNSVPGNLMKTALAKQLIITQDMLNSCTNNALLKLPTMKDEKKMSAMRILYAIALYTLLKEPDFFALISCRMVQLSLNYGVCKESVFGFACYGLVSCTVFNDVKGGYRFGQIALSLVERFEDKSGVARLYSMIYGSINPMCVHIRMSLEQFSYAYEFGMRLGDVEFAFVNVSFLCSYSFHAGNRLTEVERETRKLCRKMDGYKADFTPLTKTLLLRQAMLNLMGRSGDPLQLTGEAVDQYRLEKQILNNPVARAHMYFLQMLLGYLYGDYAFAAKMEEKAGRRNQLGGINFRFEICNFIFYGGLVWLAMAQQTKESKWTVLADMAIDKVKLWSTHAPCNFGHKLALLNAESAFAEGEHQKAISQYDLAIALAGKNEFIQEQALAYERAGLFYVFIGDASKAYHYLENAHYLYLEWGALGKADRVRSRYLSLLMMDSV